MPEPQPRQRAIAQPRTCQPHAYWAGQTSDDPVLCTPAVWEPRDAMAARFALVGDLEDGTLTANSDVHAWTLDDEPGEIGRFRPVRLLTHLQAAQSMQRAGAFGSTTVLDMEADLNVKNGTLKSEPWLPASDVEREAIAVVRRRWYGVEHERAQCLGAKHAKERAALRAQLTAEGATGSMGALESELRQAQVRLEALAARQRAERDAGRRLGADDLRASLKATKEVLEAARVSAPVSLNRAQVDLSSESLETYGWTPPVDCESGTWLRWRCGAGHERVQFCGCKGLNCSVCKEEVTRQRGNRGWERVGRLAGSFGWHVLTVPQKLRRAVGDVGARAFARASWRAVEAWHASMGFDVGGMTYIHPVGSMVTPCKCGTTTAATIMQSRLEGGLPPTHCQCGAELEYLDGKDFHPHSNVVVPLVGHNREGRTVIIPRWMSEDDLALLRDCWKRELTTLTGMDCPTPVVNYGYAGTVERARHAFRYFARSFPGWREWTTLKGGNAFGLLSNGIAMRFHHDVINAGLRRAIELPKNPCITCGRPQHLVSCSTGSPSAPATGPPVKVKQSFTVSHASL